MRLLLALSAALRAVLLVPVMVWESGRWVLRVMAGVRPDPVLPATAAAADYLDATATTAPAPPRLATVDGVPVASPTGVTLVLHARHLAQGGPAVDLADLSDELQVWLGSLSPAEMKRLAATLPAQAEALAAGAVIPSLPPLRQDVSAAPADVSEDEEPVYVWPHGDQPADAAMRSLFEHVERQRRRLA
ncbi:hypothetical protein [Methylobacterium frigidaeris]|uniref:Uncharacterized protein n=1 Tax=Methylobacterium frigidaeris TaxID=2038277 RepID=A0AA37M768_9HYPH|nr:hypothetical protein [Methylobacterium frigidaeris]GJD65768.1 hypothetical protein MPEAHAMD_5963 [Methylobacterium frigidaeris]